METIPHCRRHHCPSFSISFLTRAALHVASYIGNEKCIAVLLRYRASLTLEDSAKQTAMFPACEQGHLLAARALLDGALS